MRLSRLVASLVAILLAVLVAGALTPGAVEAKKPRSLTRHALLNAPVRGVCDGWTGKLHGGRLSDPEVYQSVVVGAVARGRLDGRLGRDGALALQCWTRQPYGDVVALYTANRRGRPVFRAQVKLETITGPSTNHDESVHALAIRGRKVIVRWTRSDYSVSDQDPIKLPMTAALVLKRGRAHVTAVRAAGPKQVAARFAAAMRHRRWKAARSVGTAHAVATLKGAPASAWQGPPSCLFANTEEATDVECSLRELAVILTYDAVRHRWIVTGGYGWD